MFSIIGLLKKLTNVTADEFRTWWLDSHVATVLAMPGLRDYRPVDNRTELGQKSLAFGSATPYDDLTVITVDCKEAFEASIASPEVPDDNDSLHEGAPNSLVLAGFSYIFVPHVFRNASMSVSKPSGDEK